MESAVVIDRAGLRRHGINVVNSTLIAWEKKGVFPKRIRIGGCVYWHQKAVEDHLNRLSQDAAR